MSYLQSIKKRKFRRLNAELHRDLGYFASTLIIIYCLSGLALNHIHSWNPDFIITKTPVIISGKHTKESVNESAVNGFGKLVGEESYKVYDFPTPNQVKIYYDNATLHLNLDHNTGTYEKVAKRHVFYQSNVLHRNSLKGWNIVADIFAIILILINITGLFVLKGKYGITGRGKWLIALGIVPPLLAIIIFAITG